MPLPPLAHPERHVAAGNRAPGNGPHQVADDLLVDQPEIIQFDQLAEIALGQILLDAKNLGALSREGLETGFELAAVFPPLEEDQGITGQLHLAIGAHGVAGLEQLDDKIPNARLVRPVPITAGQLLPQEAVQAAPADQLALLVPTFGQLLQQGFHHRIHARFAAGAGRQHL